MNGPRIIEDRTESDGRRIVKVVPEGVCSMMIDIEVSNGIVDKVVYTGGCNGNLKGIGSLLRGMKVDDAIERLDGITCGGKMTSCPDQLARALKMIR